jgi:hypothetical protein
MHIPPTARWAPVLGLQWRYTRCPCSPWLLAASCREPTCANQLLTTATATTDHRPPTTAGGASPVPFSQCPAASPKPQVSRPALSWPRAPSPEKPQVGSWLQVLQAPAIHPKPHTPRSLSTEYRALPRARGGFPFLSSSQFNNTQHRLTRRSFSFVHGVYNALVIPGKYNGLAFFF